MYVVIANDNRQFINIRRRSRNHGKKQIFDTSYSITFDIYHNILAAKFLLVKLGLKELT